MTSNHDIPDIAIRPWRLDDFDAVKAILDDTFAGTWLPQLTPEAAAAYRESGEPVGYIDEMGPAFLWRRSTTRWSAWCTGSTTSCWRCTCPPHSSARASPAR